jgi:hypothetical protein
LRLGWETNLFSRSLTAAGSLSASDPLQEQANMTLHLRQEQDLSKRERHACGKFTARNRGGTLLVRLAPDVAGHFSGDRSVNAGLRRFVRRTEKARPSGHLE